MAKYVLLAFDDDKSADEFAAAMQSEHGVRYITDDNVYAGSDEPMGWIEAFVRGIWKKPIQFCDCAQKGRSTKGRAWTRGKKFGWWVCSVCHKPSEAWAKGDAWYTALGANLLPKTDDAPEWRGSNQLDERGKSGPTGRHLGPLR